MKKRRQILSVLLALSVHLFLSSCSTSDTGETVADQVPLHETQAAEPEFTELDAVPEMLELPLDNIYCHPEYRFTLNHSNDWRADGSTLLNFGMQHERALTSEQIKIQFKGLENRSGSLEQWVQKTQDRAYASAADFTSSTPLVSQIIPYRVGNYAGFGYVLGDPFYVPAVSEDEAGKGDTQFQSFQMVFIEIEADFVLQIAISNASAADKVQVVEMLETLLAADDCAD